MNQPFMVDWGVWAPESEANVFTIYIYIYVYIYIYGVISKFLYPDSDEKHFHCVFTGLRLISSIAPTNLKIWEKTCE